MQSCLFRTIVILALCVLAGCHFEATSFHADRSTTVSTGTQTAVIESQGEGRIGVAVYEKGNLCGPRELDPASTAWGWLPRDRELVDHSRLAEWRAASRRLEELAGAPESTVDELVAVAVELPFASLVTAALETWIANRPDRAAAVLDVAEALDPDARVVERLVLVAVADSGIDDARLASWAALEGVIERPPAALAIAQHPRAGRYALTTLLRDLEDAPYDARPAIFDAVAPRLADDASCVPLVARSLDEIPSHRRSDCARALLSREGASPALAGEILGILDDFYGNARLEVYMAAIPLALADPLARARLVPRLDDLYGSDRVVAALGLCSAPLLDATLASELVGDAANLFYGNDRERVLDAVIDGPAFVGPTQSAVIRVVADEMHGATRRRLLERVIDHPATVPQNRELARLQLAHR